MTRAASDPISAPVSNEISPATRRTILLLSLGTFSSMAAQRICDAMLPELSRVFGVGLAQAAQVVSIFAITYGISQLLYGPLGDRLGKFRVITYAALFCFPCREAKQPTRSTVSLRQLRIQRERLPVFRPDTGPAPGAEYPAADQCR